ncbi:hypothetical protein AM233_04960 [Bacillus sp. FJAT-22058]|nr:hypothetical protein AM233_04960 [Bacillus sp. FJAT-22058]
MTFEGSPLFVAKNGYKKIITSCKMKVPTPTFRKDDFLCAIQRLLIQIISLNKFHFHWQFIRKLAFLKKKITHLLLFHTITNKEFLFSMFKI